LKPPNTRSVQYAQIQTKLDGTCDWIWSNPEFILWKESGAPDVNKRLLFVSGVHGCGKSVLASSIVDRLSQQNQRTVFFSFSGTDSNRQSVESMLRSWIWQLFQGNVDENTLESACNLTLKGQPLVSDLWNFLQTLAASLTTTPTYLVIDGVDECTDSIQGLVKYIVELLTTQVHFKAIVFGRPHAVQPIIDTSNLRIEIEPDINKSDIDLYIENEIGNTGVLNSNAKLRHSVCQKLRAKSDGMFSGSS